MREARNCGERQREPEREARRDGAKGVAMSGRGLLPRPALDRNLAPPAVHPLLLSRRSCVLELHMR
jgi:hypothetical protein